VLAIFSFNEGRLWAGVMLSEHILRHKLAKNHAGVTATRSIKQFCGELQLESPLQLTQT